MRPSRFASFLALLFAASLIGAALAQENGQTIAAPEEGPSVAPLRLLVKVEGAGMPGTWFDHEIHDTGECKSCHHLGRTDHKCTECHLAQTTGEVASAQLAFHENCYRCHVEGGASNGKAITCVECHKE